MSNWIKTKQPCPHCSSSDARALSSNGWWHCFSCGKNDKESDIEDVEVEDRQVLEDSSELPALELALCRSLPSRGLTEATCIKWDYRVGISRSGELRHVAVYRDPKSGEPVAAKVRNPKKEFFVEGVLKRAGLYGQHLWKPGGKNLVITEGELDALSVSQTQDNKWPVVSLPTGAQGAVGSIRDSLEFVESFDRVVLMFDNDEAGRKASTDVACLLTPGRAHIAELPSDVKDASDLLKAGRTSEITRAFWDAKPWRPDEIVSGDKLFNEIMKPLPTADWFYPFEGLNQVTRGIRRREIVTLTAGTGIGKSHLCREVALSLLEQGASIGYVALEESVQKTGKTLMAMHSKIPWMDYNPTREEAREVYDKMFDGRFYTYDHWGSQDPEVLLPKLSYLVTGLQCDVVFLDHLSILVSGMEGDNERTLLDKLMTDLRGFVEKTNCGMFTVSHLKKSDGKPHEEGGTVSLRDLRGTNGIGQLSDIVVGLERNQQCRENQNLTTAKVLKNRFTGQTGDAAGLLYDPTTGRQREVPLDYEGNWEDPEVEDNDEPLV